MSEKLERIVREFELTRNPYKKEVLRFKLQQLKTQIEEIQNDIDDITDQFEDGTNWEQQYNKLKLQNQKDKQFVNDFGPYVALYSVIDCMTYANDFL